MGNVLTQAMHNADENIHHRGLPPPPQPMYALPPPPPQPTSTTHNRNDLEYQNQQYFDRTQQLQHQPRPNVESSVIPFEPNFNDDSEDQAVPTFDIATIINDVMNDNAEKNRSVVANTSTNTQNVVNNVPKNLFSNCQIGHITFNIKK